MNSTLQLQHLETFEFSTIGFQKSTHPAIEHLQRDIRHRFGSKICFEWSEENERVCPSTHELSSCDEASLQTEHSLKTTLDDQPSIGKRFTIRLIQNSALSEESWSLSLTHRQLDIQASDELGLAFGIYTFSLQFLNISPFHHFLEDETWPIEDVSWPNSELHSPKWKTSLRAWFTNDEDCLLGWKGCGEIPASLWEQLFETQMRLGYNMVIPGTGTHASDLQCDIATRYGLWITHHHVEPLGAQMLQDVYPNAEAHYPESWSSFERLYRKAIEANAGRKILYTLGFRGQGDLPFYFNDPKHETPAQRGTVISEVVQKQIELVRQYHRGGRVRFCHNLYAESVGLYRDGHLKLPKEVIRIWGDNGYGRMQTRHFEGSYANLPAIPDPSEAELDHGIYYHVSFHDLKFAGKLALSTSAAIIEQAWKSFESSAAIQVLVLNVGNIFPHFIPIAQISEFMKAQGRPETALDICLGRSHHRSAPTSLKHKHLCAQSLNIEFEHYFRHQPQASEQQSCGDQFYHHHLRRLLEVHLGAREAQQHLAHLQLPQGFSLPDVIRHLKSIVSDEILQHQEQICLRLETELQNLNEPSQSNLLRMGAASILFSFHSAKGFATFLDSLQSHLQNDHQHAFILAQRAITSYQTAWDKLEACCQGKLHGFLAGESQTDPRETLRYLETYLGLCRIKGDTADWRPMWKEDGAKLKKRAISTSPYSPSWNQIAQALDSPVPDDNRNAHWECYL